MYSWTIRTCGSKGNATPRTLLDTRNARTHGIGSTSATMSSKEARRPGLVQAALAGKVTNRDAAHALGLSVRQFRRFKAGYRRAGVEGLLHGNRGRPSPRRLKAEDPPARLKSTCSAPCRSQSTSRFKSGSPFPCITWPSFPCRTTVWSSMIAGSWWDSSLPTRGRSSARKGHGACAWALRPSRNAGASSGGRPNPQA